MIIVPIYDMILLPGVSFYFQKEAYERWNVDQAKQGEDALFLLQRQPKEIQETTAGDFYPVGFLAEYEGTDSEGLVQMKVRSRVNVQNIENHEGTLMAQASSSEDTETLPDEEKSRRFEQLKREYLQFIQNYQWGIWIRGAVQRWSSMEEMVCASSGYMNISWEERYALMETSSERERYERMEKMIREFFMESRVSGEAAQVQQDNQEQLYREQAMKKQIDYLQRQLEELHPENKSELRVFEEKIEASGMNDNARREAMKVLNRNRLSES